MENCDKYKDQLLYGNYDDIQDHIDKCNSCREFKQSLKFIQNIKLNHKKECNISFDDIYNNYKLTQKSSNNINKVVSLAVAAMLIITIYLPFYSKIRNTSHKSNFEIIALANNINDTFENLNDDLAIFEDEFVEIDELISYELEDVTYELNNF